MKQDYSVDFLLKEFDQIETEYLRLRTEVFQRLNYFLTLSSALLGGLVFFRPSLQSNNLTYILIGVSFFLCVIGWHTFIYIIFRDINSDILLRAKARIRRYFVDNDPKIQKHIAREINDEPSGYITKNGSIIRRIAQSVLSFLLVLFLGALISLLSVSQEILIIAGIIVFIVFMFGFESYAQKKFRHALEDAKKHVAFPSYSVPEKNAT